MSGRATRTETRAGGPRRAATPGDALRAGELADALAGPTIQRKADPAATADPARLAPSDAGSPLHPETRGQMEGSFGTSFSDVRVHQGHQAPSVGAVAFTSGSHLHFAPGRYDPASRPGQELIGHELAHVVQQRDGRVSVPQAKGAKVNADPGLEAEADAAGARAAAGQPAGIGGGGGGETAPPVAGAVGQRKLDDSAGGPRSGDVIQRAIGFEFEFGNWTTRHADDKSPLAKGEEIIKGDGFKVEGEDGQAGSAIEVVTKPFAEAKEATQSVATAQEILAGMSRTGATTADKFGGKANVEVEPQGAAGKFQASPAVALDKIGDLFREGSGQSYAGFAEMVHKTLNDKKTRKKYLEGNKPSPELEGFVMLVVSYLEQGANSFKLNYPKSAFKVMARTSFDKMFALVPEHGFFGKDSNRDKWVGLVMAVASKIPSIGKETSKTKFEKNWRGQYKRNQMGMTIAKVRDRSQKEMLDAPVLGMELMGMENLPSDKGEEQQGYKSNVTRKQWLERMPDEDLLSKSSDKRFEGMGAYGDATDKEEIPEPEVPESELQRIGEESATKALPSLDTGGSREDHDNEAPVDLPKAKEAPLFELRGLRDMFGIDQDIGLSGWADKAKEVFDVVDKANAEKDDKGNVTKNVTFAPQGKPTVAPDVDNEAIWDKA